MMPGGKHPSNERGRRLRLEGKTVLITGAARGLGKHLAVYLATVEKANLVLVDRNGPGLRVAAREIEGHGEVTVIRCDLLEDGSVKSLFEMVRELDVFGLINNAGLTYFGETDAAELPRFESIIDLDFKVVVELSLLFLAGFKRKGGGFILNITSLAAFSPVPYQAVYAASKCAVQSFTESIYAENRGSPIVISTFAPSGIVTEMITDAKLTRHMEKHLYSYVTPEHAARFAVKALKRGKRLIIPGLANKLLYVFMSVLPRTILIILTRRIYRHDKYRIVD